MTPSAATLLNRLQARGKLRHLQLLVRLVELRSMGRVARSMGISQPAVTQLLRELEDLLAVSLFLRHAKGVDPTPLALSLAEVARRILGNAEVGAELVASHARRRDGFVQLGATPAAAGGLLGRALPAFAQAHPQIHVELRDYLEREARASVMHEGFDLVCCREMEVKPNGWAFAPAQHDELCVIASHRHPLASGARPDARALQAATWLPAQAASLARREFESRWLQAGWPPANEAAVVTQIPALTWCLLREGRALTYIPRSVAAPWIDSGELVALDTVLSAAIAPLGVLHRPGELGPAGQRLLDFLLQTAGTLRQPKAAQPTDT